MAKYSRAVSIRATRNRDRLEDRFGSLTGAERKSPAWSLLSSSAIHHARRGVVALGTHRDRLSLAVNAPVAIPGEDSIGKFHDVPVTACVDGCLDRRIVTGATWTHCVDFPGGRRRHIR